jgi:hypothetical protein
VEDQVNTIVPTGTFNAIVNLSKYIRIAASRSVRQLNCSSCKIQRRIFKLFIVLDLDLLPLILFSFLFVEKNVMHIIQIGIERSLNFSMSQSLAIAIRIEYDSLSMKHGALEIRLCVNGGRLS